MVKSCRHIDLADYVVIPVWYGCNNDCVICMLSRIKGSMQAVDFGTFRRLIDSIISRGRHRNLILSGAEITTFPEAVRYIQYAASLGWFDKIQIQTNGRRLSDREYLNSLIEAGVNEFFVSVHGLEAVHDTITTSPGSFREILSGIELLRSYRVNVITNTVLTSLNFHDVAPLISMLAGTQASELHIWNYFPMGTEDSRNLIVSMKDFIALVETLMPAVAPSGKAVVLKSFPQCLPVSRPALLASDFPVNIIEDCFWREFGANEFGTCVYRNRCAINACWGLSRAYINRYGDEKELLKPFVAKENRTCGI